MPFPNTGNAFHAKAFLAAYGEDVTLPDGSVIQGVFRSRTDNVDLGALDAQVREYDYLSVPTISMGTLAEKQTITVRGRRFYVVNFDEDSQGWQHVKLTPR